MIGVPWLTFTVTAISMCMLPDKFRGVAYVVATAAALNAIYFLFCGYVLGRMSDRRAVGCTCVGLLCLAALAAGWTIGLLADFSYMDEYYRLAAGARHGDVAASGAGTSQHQNASVLEFQQGTFIDTERTLGFMEHGKVYCVAPVTGQAFTDTPMYYAVGKDCCEQRSNFRCSKAEPEKGKRLTAVAADKDDEPHYRTAIRMASSVYDEKPAAKKMILKFVSNADDYLSDLWHGAFISLLCASILYAFVCGMTALFLRGVLRSKPSEDSF
jgi:hypothetical protein